MNWLVDKIVPWVFEKLPVLSALNGHKRTIGNLLLLLSGLVALLKMYFPMVPHLDLINEQLTFVIGLATRVFGDLHADSKGRNP